MKVTYLDPYNNVFMVGHIFCMNFDCMKITYFATELKWWWGGVKLYKGEMYSERHENV